MLRMEQYQRTAKMFRIVYLRDTAISEDFYEEDFKDEPKILDSEVKEALDSNRAQQLASIGNDIPIELIKKGGEHTAKAIA